MIYKIFGPPGTGKTTFLLSIVKEAVKHNLYNPKEIGFLSFSRAAAHEAKARVLKVLPEYVEADFPFFSTIHAVCRILLDMKKSSIFAAKQANQFSRDAGFELSGGQADTESIFTASNGYEEGDVFQNIRSYCLHTGEEPMNVINEYNSRSLNRVRFSRFVEFERAYATYKQATGEHPRFYDFDDMLTEVEKNGLTPRLKLLIVDEAQDLSPLMWKLISRWSNRADKVIIAGDPYQAIYEFQGARPSVMLEYPCDHSFTLNSSFRCPSQVHAGAVEIVNRMSQRYENDTFIPRVKGGFVTSETYRPGGEWDCGKRVFYLVRDNRKLNDIARKLFNDSIPFGFIRGRKPPYMTKECQSYLFLDKLRNDMPLNVMEFSEAMEIIPSKDLLVRGAKKKSRSAIGESGYDNTRCIYASDLITRGFSELGKQMFDNGTLWEKLTVAPDKAMYCQEIIDTYGYDYFEKKPNLLLGTIHSAKGKEADYIIIDPEMPKKVWKEYNLNPENEHRLAYVAMTRAKEGVYIPQCFERRKYDYPCGVFKELGYSSETLDREKIVKNILGYEVKQNWQEDMYDWDDIPEEEMMPF